MKKTYVIRIEIFNASDDEFKALRRYIKKQGFKKVPTKSTFWEISKTIKPDCDLEEIHIYVQRIIEKIDHSKVRVTTEISHPD